ncbi:MAG: ferrous iron transporter B [Candidatus Omnitrophota bacterium]|nr:MAG: ferrous iron transporter B [Candidatus Omnitrophota bacterium]
MKKILLVGNPNVGKSAIFSRLTGVKVVVANYPGTTVEYTKGKTRLLGEAVEIIDVPGIYSLSPTCKAEEVAVKMVSEADVIINVVDATNLERNLSLTLELIEKGYPVIIALNFWDETKHKGINIDVDKLQELLGVAVVPTCGLTGAGIRELVMRMREAKPGKKVDIDYHLRWQKIGEIVNQVQKLTHHHHTFLQILEELSIKPFIGLLLAFFVIGISFVVIRFIGESLINYILDPAFENTWRPVVTKISQALGGKGLVHYILIGNLINGEIDFGLSFGLLTTGLYIPIVAVLPYIFSFYLMLGILEDFGYLPRLAVLVDNLMHKLGLHGYAIISMILGLGCNVPGALATRLLENRREKFIASTLMAIAVPCMAQIAVIVGLVGRRGFLPLGTVFFTLFILWVSLGFMLNKILKGETPPLLLEIPPYRIPILTVVIKKLSWRIKGFLFAAIPYVLLGVFVVNMLYALKVIDFLAKIFTPVLKNIWGLPPSAISALLVGFLRKDVAVGMLGPLNLTTKQLIIGSVILAVYFPCVATFVVLTRELGIRDMIKSAMLMIVIAIIVGGILNLIL